MKRILKCVECLRGCELIVDFTEYDENYFQMKCRDGQQYWKDVTDLRKSEEEQKLPKLTAEVFDRPECPTWGNYAAVDKFGKGFYYRSEPTKTDHAWKLPPDCKMALIGKFDPSDWQNSLIKRPPKEELPDWVKVDNIGWHNEIGYFKVIDVDDIEKRVRIQLMDGQTEKYCSFNTACTEIKYARPRPFNNKEMEALVGKILKYRTGNYLVTAFENRWNQVEIESVWRDNEELKEFWTQLDGKPCYKLEHQNDKGEWVK